MAATRDLGNELGASQRMLTQGMLHAELPARQRRAHQHLGHGMDGEGARHPRAQDVHRRRRGPELSRQPAQRRGATIQALVARRRSRSATPCWRKPNGSGINIVNTHKGLPLGIFDPDYIHPRDVPKAARDWPNMNFVIYHSAGDSCDDLVAIKKNEIPDPDQCLLRARGGLCRRGDQRRRRRRRICSAS